MCEKSKKGPSREKDSINDRHNINNMESNIKNKGIVQKKKERFTNSFVNFQSANAVTNFICDEHF